MTRRAPLILVLLFLLAISAWPISTQSGSNGKAGNERAATVLVPQIQSQIQALFGSWGRSSSSPPVMLKPPVAALAAAKLPVVAPPRTVFSGGMT